MHFTRREFTMVSAAALAGLAGLGSGRVRRADPYFTWIKDIAPGFHVATGEGGNALLVTGRDAALLVDCKNAPFGAALRREGTRLAGTLTTVVNTHHHGDHTGGNSAFSPVLPVLAQAKAGPRVLRQTERYLGQIRAAVGTLSRSENPAAAQVLQDARDLAERVDALKPADFAPNREVGEHEELDVGGRKIVLHHFGSGHTDNDLVVQCPESDVIHTGDLVFHKLHPFMDPPAGANSAGWIASLRRILELCSGRTVVVPGHGDVTDASGVRGQIEYFEAVRAAVSAAIKEGRTRAEVEALELDAFRGLGFAQVRSRALGAIYDELRPAG